MHAASDLLPPSYGPDPARSRRSGDVPDEDAHRAQTWHLRDGLTYHFGTEREAESSIRRAAVDQGLQIVLVLEGAVDVAFGSRRVRLAAQAGAAGVPDAAVISLAERDQFCRHAHRGNFARRISLTASPAWIDQSLGVASDIDPGSARGFTRRHLAANRWQASARARAIGEQMLRPPSLEPGLRGLYIECRAIELVIEALSSVHEDAGAGRTADRSGRLPLPVFRRMCEVRAWLHDHADGPLCIDDLARQACCSTTTLQRQFRRAHGMTISAFVQQARLARARDALAAEGVPVLQAALIAGYVNPANFATAFKRCFGLTPSQVRNRV